MRVATQGGMSSKSLSFVFAVLALSASAAIACTSSTSASDGSDAGPGGGNDASTSDANTTDSSSDASSDGGSSLVPNGVTKIVFTSKGGFVAPAPDASTCSKVDITYTVTLPAREFSWKICDDTDAGPYAFETGQKTLTAEQYAPVDAALHALKRQTVVQCGADKPSEQITFTSPSGDTTYYDDFYFCDAKDPKIYVTGMEDVFSEMTKLAQ